MPPTAFSGSLPPKKKSELQEIALALRISDQGTKEELVQRITKHLDANQRQLEEASQFAGLYGRRRRGSVQPPAINPARFTQPTSSDTYEKPRSSRTSALEAIVESTPVKDLRNVSTYLKQPLSPDESAPSSPQSPRGSRPSAVVAEGADAATNALETYIQSPVKTFIERVQAHQAVQRLGSPDFSKGTELLSKLRYFLSNSRNIWSVTAVFELLYILSTIIPWKTYDMPLSSTTGGPTYPLRYPPLSIFQTSTFWLVLLHWAIPAIFLPTLIGSLITFNPALAPKNDSNTAVAPIDPLTAAIVRLAAQFGYPYAAVAAKSDIIGLDVLGSNLRVLSASLSLAFAFSEAISVAPQTAANTINEERGLVPHFRRHDDDRSATPSRRAITSGEVGEID